MQPNGWVIVPRSGQATRAPGGAGLPSGVRGAGNALIHASTAITFGSVEAAVTAAVGGAVTDELEPAALDWLGAPTARPRVVIRTTSRRDQRGIIGIRIVAM